VSRKDNAVTIFNGGYNCCQSGLGAFCEEQGLERETAFTIATGFGAGCRRGEVCGAVSGALMVLGLKYGFSDSGDEEKKNGAYLKIKDFTDRFEALHGTVTCKGILGYDISKEDEYIIIKEKDLFRSICAGVVEDATGILEDMLDG